MQPSCRRWDSLMQCVTVSTWCQLAEWSVVSADCAAVPPRLSPAALHAELPCCGCPPVGMQLTSHAALAAALALSTCDSAHHTHACNRSLTDYSNAHSNIVHAADMQQTGHTCPHLDHQTMACNGSLSHFWYRSHGNTHNQSTLHLLQLAQDIMDCSSLPVGLFQLYDVTLQALNVCY